MKRHNLPRSGGLQSIGLVGLAGCLLIAGCAAQAEGQVTRTQEYTATAEIPPAVRYWQEQSSGLVPVCWAEADLNADKRPDCVIIYRLGDGKCRMTIVIDLAEGRRLAEAAPAPVSDQHISFVDFDSQPPLEVVVTGRSGSFVGTAIFRLEGERIVNQFEDDFDKCCRYGGHQIEGG